MDNVAASPPLLLLSAPHIAGYLPAHIDPPPDKTFSYTNAKLERLAPSSHAAILSSIRDILDLGIAVALGDGDTLALIMAQSAFLEAVGVQSYAPPPPSVKRRAQANADLAEFARAVQERLIATHQRLDAEIAARRERSRRQEQDILNSLDLLTDGKDVSRE